MGSTGPISLDTNGQNLIADSRPPPEYVIEAYLETNLALHAPGELKVHAARLKALETDYRSRQAFWAKAGLPDDLAKALGVDADRPAQDFWAEIDTKFLPALSAADEAAAESSFIRQQSNDTYLRRSDWAPIGSSTTTSSSMGAAGGGNGQ